MLVLIQTITTPMEIAYVPMKESIREKKRQADNK